MKAHVALVNPPYPKEASQSIFLPLGIGYLAAVLEEQGYQVDVVDCQITRPDSKALEDKFRSLNPDIIGVTSATVTYLPALDVLKTAKAAVPKALTLMGGPHVSVLDREALADSGSLDVVVRGEGEQTMLELAKLVSEGNTKALSQVQGITYRNQNQAVQNPDRPFLTGIGTTYGDGKIFTGSFENMQLALDAKTGKILWTTNTKGPMIFTGAYADGIYFKGGSDDNTMYAFNATTGDVIWRYRPDTDGYFVTGCAVAYGMVYEMNKDGYLYAFDMYTGEIVWKYKGPNDSLMWPGMPSVADGKIYLTTGESAQYNKPFGTSEFSCLDAYNGQKLWSMDMEALPPRESVAIAYGTLYIIPGDVTTSVDTISGNEYATDQQVWAIKDINPTTPATVQTNWTQWRADPSHSSTAPVGPSNLTLAWRFQTGGSVISSPTVSNDIAYFGSTDSYIYAVDARNGNLIWKFKTGAPVESSVALANSFIYTGGDDGYVYCLNPCTGEMKWKTFVNGNQPFTFGNLVLKSSPAVADGKVFIGSLDGYLYALDWNTGSIVWQTKAGGPIESSPAYAAGAVYFTAEEPSTGMVYKLDAATGAIQWNFSIAYRPSFTGGNQMLGSPSVAEGKVFASSNWGDYYALDINNGAEIWHFYDTTATEFIVSSPIWVNGTVYLIDKFDLAAVNGTTGSAIWSKYTGDELYVSPSYADGKVYMVTSQRHIFILDVNNKGAVIANASTLSSSWSSPTIANNRLFIGCNDWNVYCFKEDITGTSAGGEQPTSTPAPMEPFTWRDYTVIAATVIIILAVASIVLYRRNKNKP